MPTRRAKPEIIAELDAKIAYHNECIKKLQARKEVLLQPPKPRVRKTSMRQALEVLKEAGLSPDEIMAIVKKAKKTTEKQMYLENFIKTV